MLKEALVTEKLICHHCGEECKDEHLEYDEYHFCCNGCKAIYELFQADDLRELYEQRNKSNPHLEGKYDFLTNDEISSNLLTFKSAKHNVILLSLPDIHCSSCVYVLENLTDFQEGVISSKVNFVKKTAEVHYDPRILTLQEVAALLSSIGYPPLFNAEEPVSEKAAILNNSLTLKIGIAAFCFGNIMMLSFPEYLGIKEELTHGFDRFFNYLNLALSLPVLIFSSRDYFISAFKGLRSKFINIDVPIALGIAVLFIRSSYEVITASGAGYFDSLAGLVFFLLIGKWFQSKTYENLSFERDYKSYFPLAVMKQTENGEIAVPIKDLQPGDTVLIRNQEIIPADARLVSESALIDYSFVTGEERAIEKHSGEELFAGGRQAGGRITIEITKATSQSYLTSLWNNKSMKEAENTRSFSVDKISKHFTLVILAIAFASAIVWSFIDISKIWIVFSSVLIVACPCALALSAPFTNGNTIRILGRNKFYLKSAEIAEQLTHISSVVFDKTGTITSPESTIQFDGNELTDEEKSVLKILASGSTHPLSKRIYDFTISSDWLSIKGFSEEPGKGTKCKYDNKEYKLGSASWVGVKDTVRNGQVAFSVNGRLLGWFAINHSYRAGLASLISSLHKRYKLHLLSGDNNKEERRLRGIVPEISEMRFEQKPIDKLNYIEKLQNKGEQVLMLGDGLNDAGALGKSNVGVAVTEDVSTFSPACDAILEGSELCNLNTFLKYTHRAKYIIYGSFLISFLYNIVGLSFAVTGNLTPIFAAILMPLSSISVVAFTTFAGNMVAKNLKL